MSEAYTAVRVEMVDQQQPPTQPKEEEIPILFLHDVERHYRQGDETLNMLNGVELALWPGQSVALVAPSGAGKSTLLHIAGLLEHPDHGDVYIDGRATAILADHERTRIRRNEIGFVYQSHHLLPEFSALENVLLPQMIRGLTRGEAKKRGRSNCWTISAWATGSPTGRRNSPAASSSGWRSRARSPMRRASCWPTSRPEISTCTPPTTCLRALTQLVRASGLATIIATHNMDLAARMDRRVTLRDGKWWNGLMGVDERISRINS